MTDYIIVNIKSSTTLLFIQINENDVDDSLQNLVDFVVRGLTDDEERKIYKCKISQNPKIKKANLDLYDPNVFVMPSKCKYDWIVINTDDKNNNKNDNKNDNNLNKSELSKLYFEKDTSKFVKDYLNEMIHAVVNSFINFSKQ